MLAWLQADQAYLAAHKSILEAGRRADELLIAETREAIRRSRIVLEESEIVIQRAKMWLR